MGHWAKECPTAPGKGLDSVKGGTGGKGYPKGGYPKGWQPKGEKDTVKCENCGKPGHLKKDCWSLKGKGGGGKATVNEVEDIDSCWEISAVNRAKTENRYNALGEDSESESDCSYSADSETDCEGRFNRFMEGGDDDGESESESD